jgi:multisubunit Na+/H+ antiporter MnhB subunit
MASLILGILATASFELFGPVIAFSYLGIPAIVTGAILLSRIKKPNRKEKIVPICEAILGIILGVVPLAFTLLGM